MNRKKTNRVKRIMSNDLKTFCAKISNCIHCARRKNQDITIQRKRFTIFKSYDVRNWTVFLLPMEDLDKVSRKM